MSSKHKIVLLLTASIDPKDAPEVAIPDSKVREKQYLNALKYYSLIDYPIVFIDSSNTISNSITNIGKGIESFEYHAFSSINSYLGKGHGEKEILDYAFQKSELLANAKHVVKINGRYCINNIDKIIEKVKLSNADIRVNFGLNLSRCDSRLIIFKPDFYIHYFKPTLEKYLDEPSKMFFENVLSRSVHLLMAEGGIYEPWPMYPYYKGINGANGNKVDFKFVKRLRYTLFYRLKIWFLRQMV